MRSTNLIQTPLSPPKVTHNTGTLVWVEYKYVIYSAVHSALFRSSSFKYFCATWGKDKVTVSVESYRFYGIKLPFLFHKVPVFGPKLPFFVGPKLPFILGQSYRFKKTVLDCYPLISRINLPFFGLKLTFLVETYRFWYK